MTPPVFATDSFVRDGAGQAIRLLENRIQRSEKKESIRFNLGVKLKSSKWISESSQQGRIALIK